MPTAPPASYPKWHIDTMLHSKHHTDWGVSMACLNRFKNRCKDKGCVLGTCQNSKPQSVALASRWAHIQHTPSADISAQKRVPDKACTIAQTRLRQRLAENSMAMFTHSCLTRPPRNIPIVMEKRRVVFCYSQSSQANVPLHWHPFQSRELRTTRKTGVGGRKRC